MQTYGFLGYPLLQAADILIYRALHVPVGEDQVPHVEMTREVARRFTRAIPEGSILARLGGDEFGVLIPGTMEETLESAHALRASLSYPCQVNGLSISVGVSVGHVYNDGAGNLLKRADDAMYRAKHSGMGVAQS